MIRARRQLLARSGAALGAGVAAGLAPGAGYPPEAGAATRRSQAERFRYSLNTRTLPGQGLSLPERVEIAARRLTRKRVPGHRAVGPGMRRAAR